MHPVSVFGDDGLHHFVVRCSHSDFGVVFFAGGGGRNPAALLGRLRDEFSRQY